MMIYSLPVYMLFTDYAKLDMSKCMRADCLHPQYAEASCSPCLYDSLAAAYDGTYEPGQRECEVCAAYLQNEEDVDLGI